MLQGEGSWDHLSSTAPPVCLPNVLHNIISSTFPLYTVQRETFEGKNFHEFQSLWLFAKVFSTKFGGVASFGDTIKQSTIVFSRKSYFPPIYLPQKFSAIQYLHVICVYLCSSWKRLKSSCSCSQVAQLINYAKNLHEEEKHIVRTLRLQQDAIW